MQISRFSIADMVIMVLGFREGGERMAKRKGGKEAKLITIMQFPPQHTIIMFLIATVDKR